MVCRIGATKPDSVCVSVYPEPRPYISFTHRISMFRVMLSQLLLFLFAPTSTTGGSFARTNPFISRLLFCFLWHKHLLYPFPLLPPIEYDWCGRQMQLQYQLYLERQIKGKRGIVFYGLWNRKHRHTFILKVVKNQYENIRMIIYVYQALTPKLYKVNLFKDCKQLKFLKCTITITVSGQSILIFKIVF